MRTISIKLEPQQMSWLDQQAEDRKLSRSHIVRELIEARLEKGAAKSLYQRAQHVCGIIKGPKDLSTRPLKGYGRD